MGEKGLLNTLEITPCPGDCLGADRVHGVASCFVSTTTTWLPGHGHTQGSVHECSCLYGIFWLRDGKVHWTKNKNKKKKERRKENKKEKGRQRKLFIIAETLKSCQLVTRYLVFLNTVSSTWPTACKHSWPNMLYMLSAGNIHVTATQKEIRQRGSELGDVLKEVWKWLRCPWGLATEGGEPQQKTCYLSATAVPRLASALIRRLKPSRFPLWGHLPHGLQENLYPLKAKPSRIHCEGSGRTGSSVPSSASPLSCASPAVVLRASQRHPWESRCCLKNKKWFPGPLPRMACAISLTPMGSPSDPSYLETSPLSGQTCLANAPGPCFPFTKEKMRKMKPKQTPNGLGLRGWYRMPCLDLPKMFTKLDYVFRVGGKQWWILVSGSVRKSEN